MRSGLTRELLLDGARDPLRKLGNPRAIVGVGLVDPPVKLLERDRSIIRDKSSGVTQDIILNLVR